MTTTNKQGQTATSKRASYRVRTPPLELLLVLFETKRVSKNRSKNSKQKSKVFLEVRKHETLFIKRAKVTEPN